MWKETSITVILSCVIIFSVCTAAAEDNSAKKKTCEAPKQFAYELDYDWVMGQNKWYFPMMSKSELLRQSSDLLQVSLDEVNGMEELSSTACFKGQWEGFSAVIKGFQGKQTSYNLSPNDWTNFNILGFDKTWDQGQSGTLYITKSDNKHFIFIVRCWEDGERSWSTMTTSKKPTDKLKKVILDHMKLLGFPEDDVEYIRYGKCDSDKKTEL